MFDSGETYLYQFIYVYKIENLGWRKKYQDYYVVRMLLVTKHTNDKIYHLLFLATSLIAVGLIFVFHFCDSKVQLPIFFISRFFII